MLFLHRDSWFYLCCILLQLHFAILGSVNQINNNDPGVFVENVRQNSIGSQDLVSSVDQKLPEAMYCTDQSHRYHAVFAAVTYLHSRFQPCLHKNHPQLCMNQTIIPFSTMQAPCESNKITMQPFGTLQLDVRNGVKHYHLIDPDYDVQSGYHFLVMGNDLYNEPLPEQYRKYLPEQYFTKKSKLWCVKSTLQHKEM